jgi:hypothetical protein
MEKEKFKLLLTDLYNLYNPANIQYVDDLVEKYNRLEFDALKNVFIKYNRKSAAYYDANIGTDKYIHNLIKEYNAGLRSLENLKLQDQIFEKPETFEKSVVIDGLKEIQEAQNEIKKEVSGEIEKKIKNITDEINEKFQEIEISFKEKQKLFKDSIDNMYKEIEKKVSTLHNDNNDVTIRIFSTYSNSELDLPNKKIIAGLGKGSRLIIKDKDDKVIGMEIIDVTYDGISEIDGKPLVEVFLEKI